jgi:pilus assembly protein Flp/PilA
MLYLFSLFNSYLSSFKREEGQGMAEYGLILALISVGAIAVLALIGPEITAAFQSVLDQLG